MTRKSSISTFTHGVLRSYAQIFFSENYWFSIPLIIVSFFDISAGFSGLIAVITANLIASLLKFDKQTISKGFYGFNSLLVGLGLGYHFELTLIMIVIAVFSGFLTLLITISLQGILGKYYLPYLSIPFVLAFWIVFSAGGMFSGTQDNQSGVYILNRLFTIGGYPLVNLHQWWVGNIKSAFLNSYFLSLGAIFFQFNVLAGIVISIALFFYSRITFLLTLLGFTVAYFAYLFLGMDMNLPGYSHIGFNFILGAIAIGGYFYIPSRQSFFWAIAITPVIAIVAAGLFVLLKPFNLALLSLPFNLILLTFIYSLRFRKAGSKFKEVLIQEGTPERNLYSHESFTNRFPNYGWFQIKLPFLGEWFITQGYNGAYTHKGEWANAWDFVITDNEAAQFKGDGNKPEDYYCYGKNVIAPADGTIVVADDGIPDNNIGEVNTLNNWGNTVIIKHADGLYSKLSHLNNGSITVKPGDNVRYGQVIGKAGNSGRSPYPHLHFQIQATPYIGSGTLKYPLFAYLGNGRELRAYSYPEEGQKVKTTEDNPILKKALNLMPGTKLNWKVRTQDSVEEVSWEVFTNLYNKSYILCNKTKAMAYFQYDGVNFCFTHFEGDRRSLLYTFYQAAFRLPLVCIESYVLSDFMPVNQMFKGWRLFLHDFTAPFLLYLKAGYQVVMEMSGSEFDPDHFEYNSTLTGYSGTRTVWKNQFRFVIKNDNSLILGDKQMNTEALCDPY